MKYKNKVIPMERENFESKASDNSKSFESVEINSVLDQLKDIYREVIDLRYNEDLGLEEISDILGIPVGTVKSRLHRAHCVLRQEYLEEESV